MFLLNQNWKELARSFSFCRFDLILSEQASGNIKTAVFDFNNEIFPWDILLIFIRLKVQIYQKHLVESFAALNLVLLTLLFFWHLNQVINWVNSFDPINAMSSVRHTILMNPQSNVPLGIGHGLVSTICQLLLLNLQLLGILVLRLLHFCLLTT